MYDCMLQSAPEITLDGTCTFWPVRLGLKLSPLPSDRQITGALGFNICPDPMGVTLPSCLVGTAIDGRVNEN